LFCKDRFNELSALVFLNSSGLLSPGQAGLPLIDYKEGFLRGTADLA